MSALKRTVAGIVLGFLVLGGGQDASAALLPKEITTPKGIKVWFIQEPSVPALTLRATFRQAGYAHDPAGKEGLAVVSARMMKEGAGPYDSVAYNAKLEALAVELGMAADEDNAGLTLKTLSANREAAFNLLRLALVEPRIGADDLARVKQQAESQLDAQAQDNDSIAHRAWRRAAFPGHPYGRLAIDTKEAVRAITQADIQAYVKQRLGRDQLLLAVVGDVDEATLGKLVDTAFGDLPEKSAPVTLSEIIIAKGARPQVERHNVPQSVVVFGQQGIKRKDPDYLAAFVMNHILGGGGFTSRLMQEVREKRGLAYGVATEFDQMAHSALWMGGLSTKNAQAAEAITLIKGQLQLLKDKGVTAQELKEAKDYLTGSFPLNLDTNGKVASFLNVMQLYDLGADYLAKRNELLNAVTLEQVNALAKRLFEPETMVITVVGDPAGLP